MRQSLLILKKETSGNGLLTVPECFHVCSDVMLRIHNIKSSGYQSEDKSILGGRQSQIIGLQRSGLEVTFIQNPLGLIHSETPLG